ncbi:MAG: hypothetical protein ACUVT8_12105, partial [Armatimonadota bacterium]
KESGVVTRNAAQLFCEEIKSRFGREVLLVDCALRLERQTFLAIGQREAFSQDDVLTVMASLRPESAEGFHIAPTSKGILVLAGNTGSGVLYAVDHVLDNIELGAFGEPILPVVEVADSPDCEIRGATFTGYAHVRSVVASLAMSGWSGL